MKKKLLSIIALALLVIGCADKQPVPIEKYGGSKYVIADKTLNFSGNFNLQLKNKDTIFWIAVINFDGKPVNVGDTIK